MERETRNPTNLVVMEAVTSCTPDMMHWIEQIGMQSATSTQVGTSFGEESSNFDSSTQLPSQADRWHTLPQTEPLDLLKFPEMSRIVKTNQQMLFKQQNSLCRILGPPNTDVEVVITKNIPCPQQRYEHFYGEVYKNGILSTHNYKLPIGSDIQQPIENCYAPFRKLTNFVPTAGICDEPALKSVLEYSSRTVKKSEEVAATSSTNSISLESPAEPSQNGLAEAMVGVDIIIQNVVSSFTTGCSLDLHNIAATSCNVELQSHQLIMRLRHPYTTALIRSSGSIMCLGATSEKHAKIAARRYARLMQKLGFPVRFSNFNIVNVLGTFTMPWPINILEFVQKYKPQATYEPEIQLAATYKLTEPKAFLMIFASGKTVVFAASISRIQAAVEHIYPLLWEFPTGRLAFAKETPLRKPKKIANRSLSEGVFTADVIGGKQRRRYQKRQKRIEHQPQHTHQKRAFI